MDCGVSFVSLFAMKMVLILLLTLLFVGASYGVTDAEIKARFIGLGVECSKDHPVTMEELHAISKHELPDHKNAKCLMACVLRKAEWMDSKGMFDVEKAIELSKRENPDNIEKQGNAKKLFEVCRQANEEPVSDGESGCDRAYILSKCLTENGRKFGFQI